MGKCHLLIALMCLVTPPLLAQQSLDSLSEKSTKLAKKYINTVKEKSLNISGKIDNQTAKYLNRLQRTETRVANIISKFDKKAGQDFLNVSTVKFNVLTQRLAQLHNGMGRISGEYLPYIDSIKGSLSYIDNNKNKLNLATGKENLSKAISGFNDVQGKFQDAELVKQFIAERKQAIKEIMNQFGSLVPGLAKCLANYNQQAYYYAAQIREYKEMLNDPDKLERRALALMNQLPAFQDFMKSHSELAGLFSIPGSYGDPSALAGLQTRDQLQQYITNQMGAGANTAQLLGQQVQAAKADLDVFKNKLGQLGNGGGDLELPNFNPNQQKTKPFLKRLEYGTNLQTQRSDFYFPTTTDVALSVGYKLSNRSIIGIGMSYKIGWGKSIQHISITSQGMGLRSFIDVKLKGSFFGSGGFEYNYQPVDDLGFHPLHGWDDWTQSGLIGVSKIVSLKSKYFKKTKLQILWDFLSYRQVPQTTPFKFRVGYNF